MVSALDEHCHFRWEDLGDIDSGRPNLGQQLPVTIYRLAQYSLRETLSRRYGEAMAADIRREAGWIAGREFCRNVLNCKQPPNVFMAELQAKLKELNIAVLRMERTDVKNLSFTFTVSEALECYSLSVTGTSVYDYDEGFIAGLLYAYTGKSFTAKKTDCWIIGDGTCRFDVNLDLSIESTSVQAHE
jgi:hypothetical protein